MSQITIKVTAEELRNADADLSITFDMQPPERATHSYPGCPATIEQVDWSVDHYTLYDDDGNAIVEGPQATTPKWLLKEINNWIEKNDSLLIEYACEEAAAQAEDWRY
jgi:hypothetical protein